MMENKFRMRRNRPTKPKHSISTQKQKLAVVCILLSALFFVVTVPTFVVRKRVAVSSASHRLLPIYSVAKTEKVLSISFDCAWGVDHTDKLLKTMADNDIRCTFFAVEFWVEKYPEYAKKIVDAGHELGTHSRSHPYMSKLTKSQIEDELTTSSNAIARVTGVKPTLFRPPYGDYNNTLVQTATALGLYTVQWDVDSLDWKNLSATEIALRVVNGAKNGSIILCHNNGLHTAEALPLIFSTLKNRGYTFVPIGELIYKDNYTLDVTGKQHPATQASE